MVTDAMIAAARDEFLSFICESDLPSDEVIRLALEAAEKAREAPHELVMKVSNDPRVSQSASFHSPDPYVPQEPVTITRIVVGFPIHRNEGEE